MFQRATLAEKEVSTLKEQLATTSPTPLQATVPQKSNGAHLDIRDQATETRIDLYTDIKVRKLKEQLVHFVQPYQIYLGNPKPVC